jgi:ribosomal protein S18 acetylase RimI-like enzyme
LIRRVRTEDLDVYRDIRLRALAESPGAFGSTYAEESRRPPETWVERVHRGATSDEAATFLAVDGPDCVGLVGCVHDDLGADFQLVSMWVEPAYRGQQVASELVAAVLSWATKQGAHTVGLWVTHGNDRAQRFYERTGFTVTGDVQPLPSDPCKNEIRMIRRL